MNSGVLSLIATVTEVHSAKVTFLQRTLWNSMEDTKLMFETNTIDING